MGKTKRKGDATQAVEKSAEALQHLSYEVLEDWMKDNQYILTGYRAMSRSFRKSFASVFQVHNETINIWSHLIPASLLILVCAALWSRDALMQTMNERYPTATRVDFVMISVFVASALVMFSASWTYHAVSNHSPAVARHWNKLDYTGIIVMIIGSFVPSIYYGHYCEPEAVRFYLTLVSTFGLVTFLVTILDRFRTPQWRPYRAGMFVVLGLSAIIPMIEALSNHGFARMSREMSLWHCVVQGVLYMVGALIYAMRVPEKYYPRTFDLVGSSHQIFHLCVVLAACTHAIGVSQAFDHRHGTLRGVCSTE